MIDNFIEEIWREKRKFWIVLNMNWIISKITMEYTDIFVPINLMLDIISTEIWKLGALNFSNMETFRAIKVSNLSPFWFVLVFACPTNINKRFSFVFFSVGKKQP
jgi:hypothetical protein